MVVIAVVLVGMMAVGMTVVVGYSCGGCGGCGGCSSRYGGSGWGGVVVVLLR